MDANDFNSLVEQYMLLDKKTLAELLALKELAGKIDIPVVPNYPQYPQYPPYPTYPFIPPGIGDYPWWPQVWYTNTSNGKEYENYCTKRPNTNDSCAGNEPYGCTCRNDENGNTETFATTLSKIKDEK